MRLAVLLLTVLVAACGSPPSSPAQSHGAASGATGVTNVPVKVSFNTAAATDLPYFVAEQEGYFRQQGLDVTRISITAEVASSALSKGEIAFMNSPPNSI